jgi:hypothetical protein
MMLCCALPLAALSQVAKDVWGTMRKGYKPTPGAGYTAADYGAAVKAILDSPYHAVDIDSLEEALRSPHQDTVVEAMVQANLLALRPYSTWAKDIEPAAFGPDERFTVVTAPSALHLYLMQKNRDTLLKALSSNQVCKRTTCD